jgi:hypothetical protein
MKAPKEMIDERLTIQNGMLKGARQTLTEQMCIELMEAYHQQFEFRDRPNPQDVNCYDEIMEDIYILSKALKRTKRR